MGEQDEAPYRSMLRETPLDERPRERLRNAGPGSLSNRELLAIILNTGMKGETVTAMADRLLNQHGGLPGLMRMDLIELARVKGVGEAKAAKVKAAFELGRRLAAISADDRATVESPEDVVNLVGIEMAALEQEQLRVVLLDTKHRVLAIRTIYQGSTNQAQVRIGELFREAVRYNAVAIVLVHNHPSGDPTPSPEDVVVTRQLVEAGRLLGVEVLDHLVIGQGRWVSLRERRLGFSS